MNRQKDGAQVVGSLQYKFAQTKEIYPLRRVTLKKYICEEYKNGGQEEGKYENERRKACR